VVVVVVVVVEEGIGIAGVGAGPGVRAVGTVVVSAGGERETEGAALQYSTVLDLLD